MAEKPKRPLSAYMLWLNEHREEIKKENPGIKVTEIAKRGGELWRGLTDKSVSNFRNTNFHRLMNESVKRKIKIFCVCLFFCFLFHLGMGKESC